MSSADYLPMLSPGFLESKVVQVAVATSSFCNARCEFCIWAYMEPDSRVMNLEEFRRLLDRFEGLQFSEFAFNVINEPFVDRTICQKLRELADRRVSIKCLFFSSNWLLPKPDRIAEFVEVVAKCDACPTIQTISLNATVSGIDERTYDRGQAGSTMTGTVARYQRLDFGRAVANVCSVIRQLAAVGFRHRFAVKAYSDEFGQAEMDEFWQGRLAEAKVPADYVRDHVEIMLNHERISFARFDTPPASEAGEWPRACASRFLEEKLVIGAHGELGLCCQDGIRSVVIGNILERPLTEVVASAAYQEHLRVVSGFVSPGAGHPCLRCEYYTPASQSATTDGRALRRRS